MIFRELVKISRKRSGFTMIELLIGLAIIGVIGSAITLPISQIFDINGRSNARMIAVKEVEDAINRINRDVQMAQGININTSDTSGLPLTLTWVDWDNNSCCVIYSEQNGQLIRTMNSGLTGVFMSHLDLSQTSCHYDMDVVLNRKVFTMQLTSTVSGYRTASETRSFNIIPRPAQQ